jgi:hypothetical protein
MPAVIMEYVKVIQMDLLVIVQLASRENFVKLVIKLYENYKHKNKNATF